MEISAMEE
jgi:serine/threonine-protein kinase mTOR